MEPLLRLKCSPLLPTVHAHGEREKETDVSLSSIMINQALDEPKFKCESGGNKLIEFSPNQSNHSDLCVYRTVLLLRLCGLFSMLWASRNHVSVHSMLFVEHKSYQIIAVFIQPSISRSFYSSTVSLTLCCSKVLHSVKDQLSPSPSGGGGAISAFSQNPLSLLPFRRPNQSDLVLRFIPDQATGLQFSISA